MPLARIVLWLASLGGLALLARSLWFEPVPLTWAVLALVAYVALCVAGMVMPTLEMYGDAVTSALPGRREIALTFDDGPFPPTTRRVLEALNARDQRATFFMLGKKARAFPELVAELHAAGHEIAVHGWEHDRLYAWRPPNHVATDLKRSADAIEAITGARPRWFRPPMGFVSPRTVAGARKAKLELVAWSVRGYDGLPRATPDTVLDRVERGLVDGAVVLLHDAAERDDFVPASVTAMERLLDAVAARGLRSVTLSELLDPDREQPAPAEHPS
ncbi:MAG: polysaccharide deacetylase family protein [Polyangiaceae bacterium]|nr:polysaccharide deacetylase family protein [Polyangiaceae bacterium]